MKDHAFNADLATRANAGEKTLAALSAHYARQTTRAMSPAEAAVARLHRQIHQPRVQGMYEFLTKKTEVQHGN